MVKLLPCAYVQARGKAIGNVVVVVVISTKIAISQYVGV